MQILPAVTALTQPFWDGTRAEKVLFQLCRVCGTNWHPPMPICPRCHSGEIDWIPAGGGGTVYTFTIVHHATHPAFADNVPYVVAVVELDEGPRIVTNIKNCRVEDVQGGMRVSIYFEEVAEGFRLPQAQPA